MADEHANFAFGSVATAPSPATSGLSLDVGSGQGALFPNPPFNATVCPAYAQPTWANAEIVRVTGRSADTFTILRQQEGTSARIIDVGDQIFDGITALTLTDAEAMGEERASDFGYSFWTFPPMDTLGRTLTVGTLMLTKLFVRKTTVISNIYCMLTTAAPSGLVNCFAGLYDSAGTLVAETADQSTPWASGGGLHQMAISTPNTIIAGGPGVFVWIGFLAGFGTTTSPQFTRRQGLTVQSVNGILTPANYIVAQVGSSLTALPGSFTPSALTNVAATGQYWGAIGP